MTTTYFKTLYDYSYHMHHRLWESIMSLSEEQFIRPSSHSIGSVHEQITHVMDAEETWLRRLHGEEPPYHTVHDYPTRESIRTAWDKVEQGLRSYVNNLTEARLNEHLTYKRSNGESFSTPIWAVLLHVVNHGTDHRAQIMRQIHDMGGKTFAQDLIFYLRENG